MVVLIRNRAFRRIVIRGKRMSSIRGMDGLDRERCDRVGLMHGYQEDRYTSRSGRSKNAIGVGDGWRFEKIEVGIEAIRGFVETRNSMGRCKEWTTVVSRGEQTTAKNEKREMRKRINSVEASDKERKKQNGAEQKSAKENKKGKRGLVWW